MKKKRKIDKSATIQLILEWGNSSRIGHSINIKKFNEAMNKPNWEKSLKEFAKFCGTPIIYLKEIDKAATISKILEAASKDKIHSINQKEFLESMELETWDESLRKFAIFYNIDPVYIPDI